MNFFYQNILNQPNWSFFCLFSKLFSTCYCSPKESEDISPENESFDSRKNEKSISGISVEIQEKGEIIVADNLSDIYRFFGTSKNSSTNRASTKDIQEGTLEDKAEIQAIQLQHEKELPEIGISRALEESSRLPENLSTEPLQKLLSITISDPSFSPINISKTEIDEMFEHLHSPRNSPFSGHINSHLRASSPLENLQFQDAFDKFMLSCCYTLTLNIVLSLWLWATFNFASLKSKQQSMAFVEKFPFVKKIVDFYSSMDPQNLKTIRIFIIIISLICNLLLAGNLLGLWLCFQKIRKLFLEK